MLCGKQLILATKPFAKENIAKSWLYTTTTIFFILLALAGTLWLPFFAARFFSSIIAGLLLVRMFIIYHDHQHHSILVNSRPANFLMTFFGIFILSPSSIWKRSHDHHHNNNSKLFSASIGSYPIVTRQKFLVMSSKERFIYLTTRHPLTIGLGYFSMFIFGMCLRSFIHNPKRHLDALIALVLHVAVSILLFITLGFQHWFLLFFLPFLIAFALGAYLFYAQHNFPGVTFEENKNWVYEKAAMESSSFMKMSPLMAWFTGNIGYHHIHHLNSKIPFYRLPEAMRKIPELAECKTTSLRIRDVYACLRLKFWDSEENRMIGFREMAHQPMP